MAASSSGLPHQSCTKEYGGHGPVNVNPYP
jgi:hypothetical protein